MTWSRTFSFSGNHVTAGSLVEAATSPEPPTEEGA